MPPLPWAEERSPGTIQSWLIIVIPILPTLFSWPPPVLLSLSCSHCCRGRPLRFRGWPVPCRRGNHPRFGAPWADERSPSTTQLSLLSPSCQCCCHGRPPRCCPRPAAVIVVAAPCVDVPSRRRRHCGHPPRRRPCLCCHHHPLPSIPVPKRCQRPPTTGGHPPNLLIVVSPQKIGWATCLLDSRHKRRRGGVVAIVC